MRFATFVTFTAVVLFMLLFIIVTITVLQRFLLVRFFLTIIPLSAASTSFVVFLSVSMRGRAVTLIITPATYITIVITVG